MKIKKMLIPACAVVLLAVIMLLLITAGSAKEKVKVILDCDMGYMNDDALALSMLLQAEKETDIELIGITLEGGNVFIDAGFESEGEYQTPSRDSVTAFLEKVGRKDIPVYRGTDLPRDYTKSTVSQLSGYYENIEYLQYCDGYGAIHAFENTVGGELCDSDEAADFLTDAAKENEGNVVIVATGPVMNIAGAVEKDADFASRVKAIYYMFGAFGDRYEDKTSEGKTVDAVGGANVTPYAEYNALYDPQSLYTCLTAPFPEQTVTSGEVYAEYGEYIKDALGSKDSVMAKIWADHYEKNTPDYPYWDPVAAFAFLYPSQTHSSVRYVTVNTDRTDKMYGKTTALSPEDYGILPEGEKEKYARVSAVSGTDGFWDRVTELFER